MVLYAKHNSVVGKAGGETERDLGEVLYSRDFPGACREITPPSCSDKPPKPGFRCQPDLSVSVETKRQPRGTWDFSRPRSLRVLPGHTDMLPRFPCRQQVCPTPAAGSDGISGRRNALFSLLLFMPMEKAQLALFFSALDPLFIL